MAQTDINLTPGEKGLYSVSFRPNLVLFWLRSTFLVTNRRIAVKTPNTILGVIPLGFEERSMPMGSVAGVNASVTVKPLRLILFLFLAIMFFVAASESGFFIVLGLICLALAANSILAALEITNNGGGTNSATVSILDKAALEKFKEKANEYIYSSTSAGTSWDDAMHNPQQFAPQPGFHPTANTQFQTGYQEQQPQLWGQPQQGGWGQAPQHQQPQQGGWGQAPQHQQPQQGGSTAVNFNQQPQQSTWGQTQQQGQQQSPDNGWGAPIQQQQPRRQSDNPQPEQSADKPDTEA